MLSQKNGTPVGDYFDEYCASAQWKRILPDRMNSTNKRRLPTPPRVEAAPYSRAFCGRILQCYESSSNNEGQRSAYFDVEFSDGVLSTHIVTVHRSALTHAKRHYCQYRRIQNNYFWEKRDDNGFENARHFCWCSAAREPGGPVASPIDPLSRCAIGITVVTVRGHQVGYRGDGLVHR